MANQAKASDITRSSAAEYLTFVASSGNQTEALELRYEDENIWLTQRLMAVLYDVDVRTVNYHIKKVFDDAELQEDAVIRKYWITADDGKNYLVNHYNLQMIIAVGFKVNNERAVQFRKWANTIVKDYTIQGWAMDDERLKNSGMVLTREYFDHLLERIREIRLSERRFYQKITDIYATALDYDKTSQTTHRFFANVQNKLHWAIHRHTAAELIMERANAEKEHMGLMTWEAAPDGKIETFDVSIARNYLTDEELKALSLIVSMYLDYAESMAMRHIPMTMQDWETRLNRFLEFNEREILEGNGHVTHEIAKAFAESEFEKYRIKQDQLYRSDFDQFFELHERMEEYKVGMPSHSGDDADASSTCSQVAKQQKAIHIRLATESDVEALTELRLEMRRERETVPLTIEPEAFRKATERFFTETLADGSFVSAIAFDGSEAVACSGLSIQRVPPSYGNPGGMRGYVTNMYTRPSWRRKGLAVKLLDMLVAEARKRGCQWLFLNASAAGRPVYERYGFVPDDGEMKLCIVE